MAGWAGFSEDELRRMRFRPELPDAMGPGAFPHEAFLSHQPPPEKKGLIQKLTKQDKVFTGQDHSPSLHKSTYSPGHVPSSSQVRKALEGKPKQPVVENEEVTSKLPSIRIKENAELSKEVELREKPRLEQLQLEQHLMEEKNKRKKALLAKAIAERSKRTQAEAVKLNRIQKQLQDLDEMVSTDIGILRNRIEQACIEFSHAKKRHDRAESEYVTAKLDLYKKTQIKEQLAEHLCTIIQQNELRKAKKLEELMRQLEVEADEERLNLEIEVEQMLQIQEAEARKQLVSSALEKTKQVSESQSSESPLEESSAERNPGQSGFMTEPKSDLDETN
ncbi:positive regulation of smoothened signaling pathway involved in dorsal/ventral neural tube patterning [Pristimantis euphronides]